MVPLAVRQLLLSFNSQKHKSTFTYTQTSLHTLHTHTHTLDESHGTLFTELCNIANPQQMNKLNTTDLVTDK